jgi:hypothetical protein
MMQQATTMVMEGKIWIKMILVRDCDFLTFSSLNSLKWNLTQSLRYRRRLMGGSNFFAGCCLAGRAGQTFILCLSPSAIANTCT